MYNFMKKGAMMLLIAGLAMSVTNCSVSTQFRASPFERALLSALNRVLLIN